MEPIVDVEVTGPDAKWLTDFLRALVTDRLVAGGTVTPGLRSIYRWQGEVQDEAEAAVVMRTRASLVPQLIARTDEEHPYEVPGFHFRQVSASPAYHQWVIDQTDQPAPSADDGVTF